MTIVDHIKAEERKIITLWYGENTDPLKQNVVTLQQIKNQ